MSFKRLLGWMRFGLLAIFGCVFAATLANVRWASARLPVFNAGDLVADPGARLGSELIVTGEWMSSGTSPRTYVDVALRGRNGCWVVCYFEEVSEANRTWLETRLPQFREVVIRGRYEGVEDGHAVLRGCRLLD